MASMLSCPKCGGVAERGGFAIWQWIISICFFPLGLLSLLAGRKPTVCTKCGFSWQNAAAHIVVEKVESWTTDAHQARPSETTDMYQELTRLNELKEKGIITEAEFESQKNKILNR